MRHQRFVPLIVASPMFLQNIDSSAMVIALPSMAATLGVPLLQVNLVVTAYLLSLAISLPLSAWLADRYGARSMFCVAIALFAATSGLCGAATNLPMLVACRVLQGLAAAMMMPVGRLILLRSVPPDQLIAAMVWFTMPPTIGRLAGPLVGGAIVSISSWHWIFFVNIPLGLLAILLALRFVDDMPPGEAAKPFDLPGFLLLGCGLAALVGTLDSAGKDLLPAWMLACTAAFGAALLALYVRRSLRQEEPVIDLRILSYATFRANVLGAAPLRVAVFAAPFLLPLMLQAVFGLSPLNVGLLLAGTALGSLFTRSVMTRAIERLGFRRVLLSCTALTALVYASHALFTPATPQAVIFATLFVSGLLSSLCLVALNTLAYADVPPEKLSHATALTAMAQQLTAGVGVIVASALLSLSAWLRNDTGHLLLRADFALAFACSGMFALLSLLAFRKLHADVGSGLRG